MFDIKAQELDCGLLRTPKQRTVRFRGSGVSESDEEAPPAAEPGKGGKAGKASKAGEGGSGVCEHCGKGPETDEIGKLQARIQKLDFTIACLMRLVQVIS